MRYIHTVEYYSAIKKSEVPTHTTAWMNLEDMLSEKSQPSNTTYYTIPPGNMATNDSSFMDFTCELHDPNVGVSSFPSSLGLSLLKGNGSSKVEVLSPSSPWYIWPWPLLSGLERNSSWCKGHFSRCQFLFHYSACSWRFLWWLRFLRLSFWTFQRPHCPGEKDKCLVVSACLSIHCVLPSSPPRSLLFSLVGEWGGSVESQGSQAIITVLSHPRFLRGFVLKRCYYLSGLYSHGPKITLLSLHKPVDSCVSSLSPHSFGTRWPFHHGPCMSSWVYRSSWNLWGGALNKAVTGQCLVKGHQLCPTYTCLFFLPLPENLTVNMTHDMFWLDKEVTCTLQQFQSHELYN